MRKIAVLLGLCLIGTTVQAQQDGISRYYADLEDDRSNTVISISGMMFSLFKDLEVEDKEDQEILDAMSELTGLKILSIDELDDGFSFYKKAIARLPSSYEQWMTVREADQDLAFYITKNGEQVIELLMFSGSEDEFFMMSIVGLIDLSTISKISREMDIEGMDELEKIEKKKNN